MRRTFFMVGLLATLLASEVNGQFGDYKNEVYSGKCVIDDNIILSEGESKTTNCELMTCQEDGIVRFRTCFPKKVALPCIPRLSFPSVAPVSCTVHMEIGKCKPI